MTAALFAVATLVLVLGGFLYFRGNFRAATLAGAIYALGMCRLTFGMADPWIWTAMVTILVALPALLLLWHATDVRLGFCLLPTIYAIPLSMLAALLLWLVGGLSLLW